MREGWESEVKYCVSVLYPPLSNYQYTPGPRMGEPEFPNIEIFILIYIYIYIYIVYDKIV
jgi:hypothetical protein